MSDLPSKKIRLTPAEKNKRSRIKKKLNQPPRQLGQLLTLSISYTWLNLVNFNFSEYKYTYDTCYVPANPNDPPPQFLNDTHQQPTTSTAPFVLHQVPPPPQA